ncbi:MULTISPECIES: hypothetical protein [Bacillus]|uniref:Uncharacterized protein n=2 Tax=Bacillus TaxID=1386 RepID=A0A0M3R9T3_9BACI|nr:MULTISPECIES: hypothetical protein [Bacillus]ALC81976.1 hypothetical protein AM592_10440 [Bacillus gobiensis]MBP1083310.1 hypothetical protein [Bacillus capparidis]MED1097743.1 hypothetical protein [Bacillus capparidis]
MYQEYTLWNDKVHKSGRRSFTSRRKKLLGITDRDIFSMQLLDKESLQKRDLKLYSILKDEFALCPAYKKDQISI